MKLQNEIKEKRKEKRLTQEELAKLLDVHRLTVLRWENGKQKIPFDVFLKLAKILEIDISKL